MAPTIPHKSPAKEALSTPPLPAKRRRGDVGSSRVTEEIRAPLQAVWLADMTADKFLPITLERPKVLLPLANKHIIDYTLEWLQSTGVEHLFMVCRSHTDQIRAYLAHSHWGSHFLITIVDSSPTAGDALRLIHKLDLIHGDFILVSGDIVGNASLTQALKEHNDRRKLDVFALMTMLIEKSAPDWLAHLSHEGLDELYTVINPDTKQLLQYESRVEYRNRTTSAERKLRVSNLPIFWRNDLQDCYVDICSPEILSLFTRNPNYQHLRPHFVKGVLEADIMEHKIFTYEIKGEYACRVDNFQSYANISKDIISRKRYPIENNIKNLCELIQFMRTESEIRESPTQWYDFFSGDSVIGKGSIIGNNPKIVNSVIGEGCVIGSDVSIRDCYIWNNVTIENCCNLIESLICDGVILKSGAVLNPGVVLSFKVVIGENIEVPAYSKVSLIQEPIKQVTEEVECDGQNSGTTPDVARVMHTCILHLASSRYILFKVEDMTPAVTPSNGFPYLKLKSSCSHVGSGGDGYIWSVDKRSVEEGWRYAVANLPENLFHYVDPDSDFDDLGDDDPGDDDDYCRSFRAENDCFLE